MYARLQLLDCGTHSSQTSPPLPSLPALRSASVFDPPEQLSRKERKLIQKVFFVSVNIIHRKLCASHAAPEVVISLQGLLRSAFVCVFRLVLVIGQENYRLCCFFFYCSKLFFRLHPNDYHKQSPLSSETDSFADSENGHLEGLLEACEYVFVLQFDSRILYLQQG
jgi:hypothetical protein